jgi:cytochrome c peroxidase
MKKNLLFKISASVIAIVTGTANAANSQAEGVSRQDIAAMKEEYKRASPLPVKNAALVELGKKLFFDPRLSASGTTACVTCHLPELGWGTKEAKSLTDSGRPTSRKSQSLLAIGHALESPIGWDGRNPTLEAQAKSSILTGSMSMAQTDRPVKAETIEARIQAVQEYTALFKAALPDEPVNLDTMVKAIAAFERTIEPGKAPFDKWIEGDEGAISPSAKRGFVVFNTKAECQLCHTGWRFTNDTFHDIGTSLKDRGRGNLVKDEELMQYAFKTPTLRSIARRPPFMHNGEASTLEEVVRHYEKGGVDRPSRSPLIKPFTLTDQERTDLVNFMISLNGENEGILPPALP